jgi:hypothetical protein
MGLANFIATLAYPGALTPDPPDPPEPPAAVGEIVAYALSPSNKFVDVYFDRPVYGEGLVALTTSEFQITDFVAGGVTVISIASVKKPDHHTSASATALAGGESVIRFFLTLTGTPDMTEGFRIKPVADSVYDLDGEVMSDTKSTGTISLNINPFALWDAEEPTTVTVTSLGISAFTDLMGNVNLAQATDADRPLYYLNRFAQFDRVNTEFLTGGTNANFQKQQANDFAIVLKDLFINLGTNSGFIIAYFNGANNHGWAVRGGSAGGGSLNFLMSDNSASKSAVHSNFEDQRGSFIIQNVGGTVSIYDENNNLLASSATNLGTIVWTSISLFVGRRETITTNYFQGDWSKLSFYNQSFTSAQRLKLYNNLKKVKSSAVGTLTKYLYPVVNGSITAAHKDTMQVFLGGVAYLAGTYYIAYCANAADGDIDRCFLAKLTTETPFTAATKELDAGEPKVIIGPSGVNGTWNENEVLHRSLIWDPDENHFKHYVTGNQVGATPAYTLGLYTSPDGETTTPVGQVYTDGVKNIIGTVMLRVAAGNWKGIVTTATSGGDTNNFSYDLVTSTDGETITKVGAITQFKNVILILDLVKVGDDVFVIATSDNRDSDPSLGCRYVMYKTDFTTYTYAGELMQKYEPSERGIGGVKLIPFSDRIIGFYTNFKNQNKTASNGGESYTAIRMMKLNSANLTQPAVVNTPPTWVKFYWPLSAESATGNVFSEQIAGGTCTYGGTMQWTLDGLNLFDFLGTGMTFSAISIASWTADLSLKMRVEIVTTGTINLFSIGTDIVVQLVSGKLRVALNNTTKDYISTSNIAKPTGITDPGTAVYVGFIWQGGVLTLCVGNDTNVAKTNTVNNAMTDIANSGTTPIICSGATIEAGRVVLMSGQTSQQWIDTDL